MVINGKAFEAVLNKYLKRSPHRSKAIKSYLQLKRYMELGLPIPESFNAHPSNRNRYFWLAHLIKPNSDLLVIYVKYNTKQGFAVYEFKAVTNHNGLDDCLQALRLNRLNLLIDDAELQLLKNQSIVLD